jgi:hypothetical protein
VDAIYFSYFLFFFSFVLASTLAEAVFNDLLKIKIKLRNDLASAQ